MVPLRLEISCYLKPKDFRKLQEARESPVLKRQNEGTLLKHLPPLMGPIDIFWLVLRTFFVDILRTHPWNIFYVGFVYRASSNIKIRWRRGVATANPDRTAAKRVQRPRKLLGDACLRILDVWISSIWNETGFSVAIWLFETIYIAMGIERMSTTQQLWWLSPL